MRFPDRRAAGRELVRHLKDYRGRHDTIVLALPRGGVPVAFEVAQDLRLPLDVFVVRKLGVPGRPELAMGAIASGGVRVLNHDVIELLGIPDDDIDAVAAQEHAELVRQERLYRTGRRRVDVRNQTILLIDDGLATGATMRAAVEALQQQSAARIVVAVPVGARDTCAELKTGADDAICARSPDPFFAVGQWYADFSQTSDDEVRDLLAQAATPESLAREPEEHQAISD